MVSLYNLSFGILYGMTQLHDMSIQFLSFGILYGPPTSHEYDTNP